MTAEHVSRETPIGTPVVFDIAEYPQGYAMGAEPTGETARGTLHTVEGDAGIAWCFVRIDPADRGDGGEFHHVPMDRVRALPPTCCPNCFQPDHGPVKACLLGVLLTVLEGTLDRELTPAERGDINARFDDDHFYDTHIPPIVDYLKALIAA